MEFAGVLPEDAPDPWVENRERARALPFPVVGLVQQPSVTDTGRYSFEEERRGSSGVAALAVSRSYTFWRNPDDHSDPANLADLNPRTRAALDSEPPWPRPAWLIEATEAMRYPALWEAVRTSWNRDASEHTTVAEQLRRHANHVLVNQYREKLGLPSGPADDVGTWKITPEAVRENVIARLDDTQVDALEIDTDPLVYAVGFALGQDLVVTAVLPRDYLSALDLAFTTATSL